METPDWQWNEMQQVGTDYTDLDEIAKYDERMAGFRNVDEENRDMLRMLALPAGAAVLEIGCGTGRFTMAAAAAGLSVSAIDVSARMIEYLSRKAQETGLQGIVARHGGFLTMDFPPSTFDAVVSGAVLHHLPDSWKLVALRNVARVLKPGGQLLLGDVVFTLAEGGVPEGVFERFAAGIPAMRKEAARHVAKEYSTYDWIQEGLLARAGFEILLVVRPSESFALFHCRKA
jgi:ubiquinone/menaquinone biosynthesis C-methylase UbiE